MRTLLLAIPLLLVPAPAQTTAPATPTDAPPIRVGLRARLGGADRLTSLRYVGGFETKTLLLQTLVRRDPDGRIVGELVRNWTVEDGGRAFRFRLKDDLRFHDGTPVDAAAVVAHLRRWMGHEEHDWLAVNPLLDDAEELDPKTFRITLKEPFALLEELVAINPCAVVAPTSNDWEGEFVRPIGTGPFRFVSAADDGSNWTLAPVQGDGPPLQVSFYPRGRDATPIDDLLLGRIDAFVGGWDEDLPAGRLTALDQDPRYRLVTSPGSSVVLLAFRFDGPTAELAVRQRVRAAIDRAELIRVVEGGRAEPCATWAAPSVAVWPAGPEALKLHADTSRGRAMPAAGVAAEPTGPTIRVTGGHGDSRGARVAMEVVAQLRRAGIDAEYLAAPPRVPEAARARVGTQDTVRPRTTESGEVRAEQRRAARERTAQADVRVEVTYGMPYCPHHSLVKRFGSRNDPNKPRDGVPDAVRELVDAAAREPEAEPRTALYEQIQVLLDTEAIVVPLYAPWRVAVHRADVDGIRLGPGVYSVDLTGLRRDDG